MKSKINLNNVNYQSEPYSKVLALSQEATNVYILDYGLSNLMYGRFNFQTAFKNDISEIQFRLKGVVQYSVKTESLGNINLQNLLCDSIVVVFDGLPLGSENIYFDGLKLTELKE